MIVFASASLLSAIKEAVNNAVPTESVFNALVNSLIYSSSFRFIYHFNLSACCARRPRKLCVKVTTSQ